MYYNGRAPKELKKGVLCVPWPSWLLAGTAALLVLRLPLLSLAALGHKRVHLFVLSCTLHPENMEMGVSGPVFTLHNVLQWVLQGLEHCRSPCSARRCQEGLALEGSVPMLVPLPAPKAAKAIVSQTQEHQTGLLERRPGALSAL